MEKIPDVNLVINRDMFVDEIRTACMAIWEVVEASRQSGIDIPESRRSAICHEYARKHFVTLLEKNREHMREIKK